MCVHLKHPLWIKLIQIKKVMLLGGQPDIVVEPVVEPPLLVVDVVLLLTHIVFLAPMAAIVFQS